MSSVWLSYVYARPRHQFAPEPSTPELKKNEHLHLRMERYAEVTGIAKELARTETDKP
ncbi:hypothetical protein EDD11_002126, partial [Mortierella claussenii]